MRRRRENDEMGEKVSSVQRSGGRKGKVESTKVDLGPLIFRRILPDMGPTPYNSATKTPLLRLT
jgi:hypothetical protein